MPRPLDFQDAEERYAHADAVASAFAQAPREANLPATTIPGGQPPGISSDAPVFAQAVPVPRDIGRVFTQIAAMAAAAGNDWYYSFPAKDRATGQKTDVEGPSIKAAMNVARIYGNCLVDSRVVDAGDSWIIYAKFVDYENGFTLVRPFQQRKGQQAMGSAGRANDMVFSIGVSKALRNVITNALESFTDFAFDEAKGSVVERIGKKLDFYRGKVAQRLNELGVEHARVERLVGRKVADMLAHDLAKVIAEIQAVADGMSDPSDIWPGDAPERPTRTGFSPGSGAPPRPAPTNPMAGRQAAPEARQEERVKEADDTPAVSEGDAEAASWGAQGSAPAAEATDSSMKIPLKKAGKHPDWVAFVKDYMDAARAAPPEILSEFEAENAETVESLRVNDPVGYEKLTEAMYLLRSEHEQIEE